MIIIKTNYSTKCSSVSFFRAETILDGHRSKRPTSPCNTCTYRSQIMMDLPIRRSAPRCASGAVSNAIKAKAIRYPNDAVLGNDYKKRVVVPMLPKLAQWPSSETGSDDLSGSDGVWVSTINTCSRCLDHTYSLDYLHGNDESKSVIVLYMIYS